MFAKLSDMEEYLDFKLEHNLWVFEFGRNIKYDNNWYSKIIKHPRVHPLPCPSWISPSPPNFSSLPLLFPVHLLSHLFHVVPYLSKCLALYRQERERRKERDHTLKLATSVEEGEDLEQKINCCDLQIVWNITRGHQAPLPEDGCAPGHGQCRQAAQQVSSLPQPSPWQNPVKWQRTLNSYQVSDIKTIVFILNNILLWSFLTREMQAFCREIA